MRRISPAWLKKSSPATKAEILKNLNIRYTNTISHNGNVTQLSSVD